MTSSLKPWLLLPTQFAHDLSAVALRFIAKVRSRQTLEWNSFDWKGLHFSNPLGLAGGVDKNAENLEAWWTFGPGFLEIGTITPLSQLANPKPILMRDKSQMAVWNKMGFPNKGLKHAVKQLSKLKQPHHTPIFLNIGKNRDTPIENAANDYITCIKELKGFADAFVINISSPNTENLRQLFEPTELKRFLEHIISNSHSEVPLLLKISPDMDQRMLGIVLDVSFECGIDGWILTNTTTGRGEKNIFPDSGGVSGRPLAERAKFLLRWTLEHLGERRKGKLIVSTGGALSEKDVFERLALGADLVQVYTALVFHGPFFFQSVARHAKELKHDS